jgi:hypothetical protein
MQVAGVVAVKYIKELVRVSKDLFLIEGCRLRMGDISQELHMAWDKMTHSAVLRHSVVRTYCDDFFGTCVRIPVVRIETVLVMGPFAAFRQRLPHTQS